MNSITKKILLRIYQFLIYLPIGIILTISSAIITVIICLFFPSRVATLFLRYCWARPMVYLLFCKVRVIGSEHLVANKSVIFISNHQGAFDIFLLYGWLKADFRWIMKKELMKIPFVGYACKKVGHITVDRNNKRSAARSIEEAKERLIGGASVVFFPEGTRSKTGDMGIFKRGAFHLARELNLPIIPLTINGVYKVLKGDAGLLHPFKKLELIIHPCIESEEVNSSTIETLCNKGYAIIKGGLKK